MLCLNGNNHHWMTTQHLSPIFCDIFCDQFYIPSIPTLLTVSPSSSSKQDPPPHAHLMCTWSLHMITLKLKSHDKELNQDVQLPTKLLHGRCSAYASCTGTASLNRIWDSASRKPPALGWGSGTGISFGEQTTNGEREWGSIRKCDVDGNRSLECIWCNRF